MIKVISYQRCCEGGPQQDQRWLQSSQSSSYGSQRQQLQLLVLSGHHHCWPFSAANTSAVNGYENGSDWHWWSSHPTLLRRWSEDSMLEDLEVFMAVEVVEEEDEVKLGLDRSWNPGLGSPTLVAPVFIMASRQKTRRGKIKKII